MTNPATGQVPATEETPEDATRRLARRLYAIERLCSGRPGYHTITVKALLTAMSDADDEQHAAGAPADPTEMTPAARYLAFVLEDLSAGGRLADVDATVQEVLRRHATELAAAQPPTEGRAAILRAAADRINALPQDYELDPGRGDAAELLRRMANGAEQDGARP